jgi:hypothetical protein
MKKPVLSLAALALAAACSDSRNPTAPAAGTPVAVAPKPTGPVFDNVHNDLDASIDAVAEIMPLDVGASKTTTLYVQPTNGDGKNGCNLTGGTTLTLSISSNLTAVATVSPSSVTFTSCGETKELTITGVSPGSGVISARETANNTGATFALQHATFNVNVTAPRLNTAPTLSIEGVAPGASYNKGSVPTAMCRVVDAEDGNKSFAATLSSPTGLWANEGYGSQTASCRYTDAGDLSASANVTYAIVEATPPVIGYTLNPTAPNGSNGWYKGDVTLDWTVTDNESTPSLTGCTDVTISADQAETSYSCSAVSAGGSAASQSVSIKRDANGPTITPADVINTTWRNTPLTQKFTASDVISGLAVAGDAEFTLTASAESQKLADGTIKPTTATKTVADNAGNSTTRTLSAQIDVTKPTISGAPTTSPNAAGWYKANVMVNFTCADALSGVASCGPNQTLTNEGANQSASGTAADHAGNTASATESGINIDKTAPVVSKVSFLDADIQITTGTTSINADVSDGPTGSGVVTGVYTINGTEAGTMTASGGTATGRITAPSIPGVYYVCAIVTDKAGNASTPTAATCGFLAVYDPNGGFVTGGGWINSPENACRNFGACTRETVGRANFGFVSKYLPAARRRRRATRSSSSRPATSDSRARSTRRWSSRAIAPSSGARAR